MEGLRLEPQGREACLWKRYMTTGYPGLFDKHGGRNTGKQRDEGCSYLCCAEDCRKFSVEGQPNSINPVEEVLKVGFMGVAAPVDMHPTNLDGPTTFNDSIIQIAHNHHNTILYHPPFCFYCSFVSWQSDHPVESSIVSAGVPIEVCQGRCVVDLICSPESEGHV